MTDRIELPDESSAAEIVSECEVLDSFLEELRDELNDYGVKDPDAEVSATEEFAIEVVRDCVRTYGESFGKGVVGKGGGGRSSAKGPLKPGDDIPTGNTGLLYGKVQSGKTKASIASIALASCNGFRVFIVMTSDNTLLGEQTVERFREKLVEGPRVVAWTDLDDPEKYAQFLVSNKRYERTGVLFVTTKNVHHLRSLHTVLVKSKAHRFPALIIDDEADNASLDTQTRKKAKNPLATDTGAVFAAIGDLRRASPHHVYLQVTATPQSLLLQALDTPCRPVFCQILEPGAGYTGGDAFFGGSSRLWAEVPDAEHASLLSLLQTNITGKVPQTKLLPNSLRNAIGDFLIASAHMASKSRKARRGKFSFLAHVSLTRSHHERLYRYIQQFATETADALQGHRSASSEKRAKKLLRDAHTRLSKSTADLLPFADAQDYVERHLPNAVGHIVNADAGEAKIKYRRGPNFLVGGNRLGRGLTIPNLLVTYYGRAAKAPMSDTVHQHARMFGYREPSLEVSRFYAPKRLFASFKAIHKADEQTRGSIGNDPKRLPVAPIWVGAGLRPTRANVLDPTNLGALSLTRVRGIYPPDVLFRKREISSHTEYLDRKLAPYADGRFHTVDLDDIIELLKYMPSRPVDGYPWRDDRVPEILKALKPKPVGVTQGSLWVKLGQKDATDGLKQKRHGPPNPAGFLDGSWRKEGSGVAKRTGHPVLMVTKLDGNGLGWDGVDIYTPTVLFPALKYILMYAS